MESNKRRMLYGLLQFKLFPIIEGKEKYPLIFDFLEDKRSNPLVTDEHVNTGFNKGVITLNVLEADPGYREATREAMNELYRSLLGHFRHEIGHYFWQELIEGKPSYTKFKQLFGDDTINYQQCLDKYYSSGPKDNWRENYISAYASSHPLEDWAETWAHYMSMTDTLETALSFNIIKEKFSLNDFEAWIDKWMGLVVILNALNRSLGNKDAYPFVISKSVRNKLHFIHNLLVQ